MSIDIVGGKSLVLLNWGSGRFSNKELERRNTRLSAGSFHASRWNTLRFNHEPWKLPLPIITFDIVGWFFHPFVRQPFSKQLYFDWDYLLDITLQALYQLMTLMVWKLFCNSYNQELLIITCKQRCATDGLMITCELRSRWLDIGQGIFLHVYARIETKSRSINSQKNNEANI